MARPRKSAQDKLVPVKTTVSPARFDELYRQARATGESLSAVIRRRLETQFREPKTPGPSPSC